MNSKLEKSVDKFVEYQENKDMAINDDVIMLLNENDLHIGESVDVPKVNAVASFCFIFLI